jgi:RNA polymerase sigma-70 factor (ECF subfamily)
LLGSSLRRGRVEASARDRLGIESLRLSEPQITLFDEVIAADGASAVEEWLEGLPADQREAVRLRVLEERPYASIANDLGRSQATIRQRVRRGLAALRDQIGESP